LDVCWSELGDCWSELGDLKKQRKKKRKIKNINIPNVFDVPHVGK
jgi:hypothetical protein